MGDGNWVPRAGSYVVHVGTSSMNTPLQATVNLNAVAVHSSCGWFQTSTMVATFERAGLTQLAAGQNVTVSLATDTATGGVADTLFVTTTVRVIR